MVGAAPGHVSGLRVARFPLSKVFLELLTGRLAPVKFSPKHHELPGRKHPQDDHQHSLYTVVLKELCKVGWHGCLREEPDVSGWWGKDLARLVRRGAVQIWKA